MLHSLVSNRFFIKIYYFSINISATYKLTKWSSCIVSFVPIMNPHNESYKKPFTCRIIEMVLYLGNFKIASVLKKIVFCLAVIYAIGCFLTLITLHIMQVCIQPMPFFRINYPSPKKHTTSKSKSSVHSACT